MFTQYKNRLYNKLVHTYPEVAAHYEGYKDSNPTYHEQHHWQSLKFLRQLNKYYKDGKKGDFPKPPKDYIVKDSDVYVYADRQEPTQTASAKNVGAPTNTPVKPAATAPKPATPAPKPAAPAAKPAAPAAKPAAPAPKPNNAPSKPAQKQNEAPKPSSPASTTSSESAAPVVKPYMDGPESGKAHRMDPYHFAVPLLQYNVISFDIFDTLVFRKLNQPADVFMLVGERLGIFDFYNIRKKSEEEVRQYKNIKYKNSEVTLEEIYERVAYYTGIDAKKGADTEFEIELDMCFANPYMLQVYEILKASQKRIFATSNMYLTKERMKTLLNKCGYYGFEDILVSCDYHCSKATGDLFKILQSEVKESKIVHIGDNVSTDIKSAEKVGIAAKYYQSCRSLGDPHRSCGISWLIESAYRGIVNTTLHNGTQTFSPLWEYGFIYGGLTAFGYVNWIHKKAKSEGISKIIFLSRDGFLLKKIYDMLFQDIPSEYVFWSRVAAFRNVAEGERYSFLHRVIMEQSEKGVTIGKMLKIIGLTDIENLFCKNHLSPECLILNTNSSIICDVLVNNWEKVENALKKAESETELYLSKAVDGHKSVAVVDIGWTARNSGSFVKLLNQIMETNEDKQIKLYMLGSISSRETAGQSLADYYECYMFNSDTNRDVFGRINKERPISLEIIEKLFNAPHCSFMGFSKYGEMDFATPEVDNYRGFEEIESGILDFCRKYYNAFKKYTYLFNISGYDSFIPIRLLLNHQNAALNIIGKLTFNVGIVPENRKKLSSAFGGKK